MLQKPANKVGIVRFSALGDVALTIPVVYNACLSNPQMQFVMVTRKAFAALFVNAPQNLTVRGIDLKNEYKGLAGMYRLASELDVDTFVDLHSVMRTWMLDARLRLKGVRVSVFDKARAEKKRLVRNGANHCEKISPVTVRYARAFRAAGIKVDSHFRGLYNTQASDPSLYSAIHGPKQKNELWIGVAPFAAHAGKVYPIDLIQRAVREMVAATGNAHVFLFGGGKAEKEVLENIAKNATSKNVCCVAGSGIGFAGELALMSDLDVMVCMDSGNMHMAAIAGARTVSVWGATHPAAGFCPWHPEGMAAGWHKPIQIHRDCRPCSVFGNKPCRFVEPGTTPPCMAAIDPLTITFAALDINKKPII